MRTFTYSSLSRTSRASNPTTLGSCSTAVCNPAINASDNRIAGGQGYSFDNAGNTTVDAEGRQFTYDAENKQVLVKDAYSATIGTYFYDGDGKRVKKTSATSDNIIFIYNAAGKLIEERNASTGALQTSYVYAGSCLLSTETSSGTSYLTNDHLGSPRINTDGSGTVTARHDYHPFGEEILRSGYGSDIVRKQFTGKERDVENNLDYFLARQYSSQQGRFISPDPVYISADRIRSPQGWNLYNYVGNNPLAFTDPTGMERIRLGQHTDKQISDRLDAIDEEKKGIDKDPTKSSKEKKELKSALDKEKNNLKIERDGNALARAMIAALPKEEREGLTEASFTIMTDVEDDIAGWEDLQGYMKDQGVSGDQAKGWGSAMASKAMFVIDQGKFSQQIFINYKSQNISAAMLGNSDFIAFAASIVAHEKVHRGGVQSEFQAYTEQKRVLDRMPNAFSSPQVFQRFMLFVTEDIKRNKK